MSKWNGLCDSCGDIATHHGPQYSECARHLARRHAGVTVIEVGHNHFEVRDRDGANLGAAIGHAVFFTDMGAQAWADYYVRTHQAQEVAA